MKAREEKRLREKQVAIENDIQVRGKLAHRLNQKELDQSAHHDYRQRIEGEEAKRLQDKHELHQRITKVLNRSPVYVGEKLEDDDDSVQRIQERRAQEEKLREDRKREQIRRMQDDVKYHLDIQVKEKKAR